MDISERSHDGVVILALKSREAERGSLSGFHQLIRDRLAAGQKQFVLNLSECGWIDSQSLGELVRSLVAVMRQGGNMKLAETPPRVKGILSVTNLTQVFELFESEASAVKSFESGSPQ